MSVVILAAGQGKRMKSALPKVLHPIAGTPMLRHVVQTARSLNPQKICIVYGHGGDQVRAAFEEESLAWAKQDPQHGTGHAVMQALPEIGTTGVTLILYGDVPLITKGTLAALVGPAAAGKLAWLTQRVANPAGLGRVLRDVAGKVRAIVEEKDATPEQRQVSEINTGFLACPTAKLAAWLPRLTNNNAQGEYYLTDILAMAVAENIAVDTPHPAHGWEVVGVNSKDQLAQLERDYQRELARRLMTDGVMLADPARIDVRGQLTCESDVAIDINCVFEGKVHLSSGAKVGANCILRDCTVGANTEILPYTFVDGGSIGEGARIGPYARIRPGTVLGNDVHIGNFVEVKASEFGQGSKANHLSYIGDSTVGKSVNIGAGTITCNYDGANKHRTVIEDSVHIGSDVQLVAPVTIGKGADIAAGTTVWKDVAPGGLTLNT
ncbi:MAG: bifunctional UDP-N-acetylglucosamine diphosphorylase/glucosamine-1-phosphate N-acetyltransferase GlmU, partial [Betaproteobacteria bacterium]|nr:bifunctional UDP-N-acetylglucosamine diphosphorylase/glucosamine-1-phosphate N-acetyltransferase GlmU [Betaproteobacteria bacterium]